MRSNTRDKIQNERGAGKAEYVLMLTCVAIFCIFPLFALGQSIGGDSAALRAAASVALDGGTSGTREGREVGAPGTDGRWD